MLHHYIAIIDSELSQELNFDNRKKITTEFIDELMSILIMKPLAKLEIYDALDDMYPGWSFIQPITTSHISGHYFCGTVTPQIHLDIYSCKIFEFDDVLNCANKHFGLSKWSGDFISRTIINRKIKTFGST